MRILLLALCTVLITSVCGFAASPASPGDKERCPVCGMFVAPYPNWLSVVTFKDGTTAYFDGPKDLFSYVFNLKKYHSGAKTEDIADIFVTEYYSTQLHKASEVFFVTESDVMGPMGPELVPVAGKETALTFLRDHKGKKIMRFDGKAFSELPAVQ